MALVIMRFWVTLIAFEQCMHIEQRPVNGKQTAMSSVTEIILDAAFMQDRIAVPPTSSDLERLLAILKERTYGTLYLMTSGDRFLMVGVAGRVWLARISRGPDEPWVLSNPPCNGRSGATFDCGNTPTRIEARFTCRRSDAILACREFFLAPEATPSGSWIGEWSGLSVHKPA